MCPTAATAVRLRHVVLLLLPLDLTGQVGADKNGPIPGILEAVRAAKKSAYVGSNALWLLLLLLLLAGTAGSCCCSACSLEEKKYKAQQKWHRRAIRFELLQLKHACLRSPAAGCCCRRRRGAVLPRRALLLG